MSFARRVTLSILDTFAPLLRRVRTGTETPGEDEESIELDEANQPTQADTEREAAERLFAGVPVRVTNPFHRGAANVPTGTVAPTTPRPAPPSPSPGRGASRGPSLSPATSTPATTRGRLVWEKSNLPPSDVQRQTGNPTGGMRLTQARFRDSSGSVIDQTTYFRQTVFGSLSWRRDAIGRVAKDVTRTPFHVVLLGRDYGVVTLEISDKPSGEAGQGNYTSILHWGELSQTVYSLNLVGKTVRLYAPATSSSPFSLEVV